MEEIAPGLHRLSIPIEAGGEGWTTSYVFASADKSEGIAILDPGYGTRGAVEAITAQLAELGHTPQDVKRIIASHMHPDHMGMSRWLKAHSPGCELIMMGSERFPFQQHRTREQGERLQREWVAKHGLEWTEHTENEPGPERYGREERELVQELDASKGDTAQRTEQQASIIARVEPDIRLNDGDEFAFGDWTLRAVWTPGHTPGHLCIYEPEQKLTFTGDHVLSRITPNVSVGMDDEAIGRSPLREYRASLEKIARFDTARGLPSHQAIIDDLPARCLQILEHHDARLDEVREALGEHPKNATEVSTTVPWSGTYADFTFFKRRAALGETLSHLQILVEDGRARRIEEHDGRVLWQRI